MMLMLPWQRQLDNGAVRHAPLSAPEADRIVRELFTGADLRSRSDWIAMEYPQGAAFAFTSPSSPYEAAHFVVAPRLRKLGAALHDLL